MWELPCPFISSQGCGDWEALTGNVFDWSLRPRAKITEVGGRRNSTGSSAPWAPRCTKLCLCLSCTLSRAWSRTGEAAWALAAAGYLEREGWTASGHLQQRKTSWTEGPSSKSFSCPAQFPFECTPLSISLQVPLTQSCDSTTWSGLSNRTNSS